MMKLRRAGRTLDEVGQEFGVTRERVRQLMTKYGGPDSAEVRQAQTKRDEETGLALATSVSAAVADVLSAGGPMSAEEVAEQTGLDISDVARFWPRNLAHLRLWQHAESMVGRRDHECHQGGICLCVPPHD
jgi:hypothetical protein